MMDAAHYTLEPPDAGRGLVSKSTGPEALERGAVPQAAGSAGLVPTPTRFPYEPNPRTYT